MMAADVKKGHESSERDVRDADARGYRKVRRGYVTSDKMDKTIVVEVEGRVKHPLYGKVLRRSSKVKTHDDILKVNVSSVREGDLYGFGEGIP